MLKRALLAFALTVPLIGAAAPTRVLTCASPVKQGDTARTLKARYGAAAKVMKIHAAEGEMVDGMALWPNDPARRIDVFFSENPRKGVETIRITNPRSRWRIGGLRPGSRLDDVVRANGRAVKVGGFGWDYGGGVDPRGGKLAKWPGGCRIALVMDLDPDTNDAPNSLMGEGVELNSGNPALRAARPVVTKVFISWP